MTPSQIGLARHALGLDGRRKQSYRNRYFCSPTSAPGMEWERMVTAGDADFITEKGQSLARFWLTKQGALKALKKRETLCPEDFPA